jgi:predicted RNase H-like HicB family nuclease
MPTAQATVRIRQSRAKDEALENIGEAIKLCLQVRAEQGLHI